jgi:hypothetical protein
VLGLFAFYAVRGVPLQTLAASTPAEIGFLHGARAIYYEELTAVMQKIAGMLEIPGGEQRGD